MICLSCKDTGRTLGLREMGLGLASYNQRWPQRRQCWPEPPAQPFHSTNGLLCLCLFNSNGIQAREIHYCFCQGGLRLAERMHRRALTGVSTLRRAVCVEPSARSSTPEGVCLAPWVWGQEKTPAFLPAGTQPSKTPPKCQVSREGRPGSFRDTYM